MTTCATPGGLLCVVEIGGRPVKVTVVGGCSIEMNPKARFGDEAQVGARFEVGGGGGSEIAGGVVGCLTTTCWHDLKALAGRRLGGED